MTDAIDPTLTFAAKLDRLFNVCRSQDQPEQSVEEVARSVSHIIGRPVTGSQISALRHEGATTSEHDILRGLATHFGVSAEYLTSTGAQAEHVDKQLRLLAAARDAGVKRLTLRGGPAVDALGNIVCDDQLTCPQDRRATSAHTVGTTWQVRVIDQHIRPDGKHRRCVRDYETLPFTPRGHGPTRHGHGHGHGHGHVTATGTHINAIGKFSDAHLGFAPEATVWRSPLMRRENFSGYLRPLRKVREILDGSA